jgi:tRNA-splicing ligase RtcB
MKKVISTERIPIKLWLDDIEEGTLAQARNLANLPFAFKWIAIMPDAHQGYGMPIGGVMATENVIVPNAVGVDIGCGMCAVKTSLTDIDTKTLKKIMREIREVIPTGFNRHKENQDSGLMPDAVEHDFDLCRVVRQEYENALKSLGTLGGGNHFIEIQKGDDGHIWIMLHSGSRNLGFTVANYYNRLAQKLTQKWHSNIPPFKGDDGLAFFPIDSKEGKNYIKEMNYCVEFALANRKLMIDRVKEAFEDQYGPQVSFEKEINIAHNYAQMENHFGRNVMVHRKGATKATKDTIGIIPGSMGTSSYIVKGLGNPESFNSCSHGAGRKMGRKEAIRTLNLEEEQKKMEGIIGKPRSQNKLDEAPGAYKDINIVMENQKDLVEILVKLKPLASIKA